MDSERQADLKEPVGRPRSDAVRMVAAFYVAAALLNGPAILRTAERLEHGAAAQRMLVAVAKPLAGLSHGLGADRLRAAVERLADRWFDEPHVTPAGSLP